MAADEVVIVLGHRHPEAAGHLISHHAAHRVSRAERVAQSPRIRAVLFSGWSDTGQASEAQQMQDLWQGPAVPLLLEHRARSTAENAAYCLPMVLRMSDVRRVTVVTCRWHFRTRYMFAPYKKMGLDVRVRHNNDGPRECLENLWGEIRQVPHIRRVRAAAYARIGINPKDGSYLS